MPDIIVLSEIWINDDETDQYSLTNYNMFIKCNNTYRAGGIAVFVSNQITSIPLDIENKITADYIHLQITLSCQLQIDILAIYRLQEFPINTFTNELISILSLINSSNLIVIGDLNINILDQSPSVDDYLIKLASQGMQSLINEPTRITDLSKTCIDHIFYRTKINSKHVFESSVISTCITDHMMTAMYITCDNTVSNIKNKVEYNKVDINILISIVKDIDWSDIYNCECVSLAIKKFYDKINMCIQFSSSTVNMKSKFLKPWMTLDLKKEIDIKNRLFKRIIRQPNNEQLNQEYKLYKNRLLNKIRLIKNNYYSKIFEENKKNSKKQWLCIKELIGTKAKQSKIVLKDESGSLLTSPKDVANKLNEHFCTIANKLRQAILQDNLNISYDRYGESFRESSNGESIFFYPTSREEVLNLISNLKNNKAPGYDKITPLIVKSISGYIVDVLVYIFNLSLSSGTFPTELKKAVIIPLFKKNDKLEPTNYRPISLLPILSKLLEKIVKVRVIKFLNKHNYFSKNQYGFQSGLNTGDAVLDFMSKVYTGKNEGKICAGIFVDVMKAFDTVDHVILLNRMRLAGIRGIAYNWFHSYLTGRTQMTKVNDVLSSDGELKHGVPQGSVLSGLLFLIYLNNLCNGMFRGSLVAFADDTALFYRANSIGELEDNMQYDVNALRWWFTSNQMVMSPKTKYIIFAFRKQVKLNNPLKYHNIDCSLELQNCTCQNLEQVENIKYLGLWVDSNLSWKEHINSLKIKLVKYIRIFYMLRTVCYPKLMRTLYFALINSKLEYGIEVWGGAYHSTIFPLITLQKAFVRIISNKSRFTHSAQLFQKLNILPFKNLFIYKTLKVYFNRSGDKKLVDFYRVSRNKLNVIVPKPNFTMFRKFFLFLAPTFFNMLPNSIKECSGKFKFLKLLRKHLIMEDDVNRYFSIVV